MVAARSVLSSLAELARQPGGDAPLAVQRLLATTERWPARALLDHQLSRVTAVVEHAQSSVPFYAERLSRFDTGRLTLERFRELPLLERSDLQERGAELASRHPPPGHAVVREATTSGSTGAPVTVRIDEAVDAVQAAIGLRYHIWHGRDLTRRAAIIRAIKDGSADPPHGGREPRWSPHPASGDAVLLDVRATVREQLDWLARAAPDYVLTYATNADELVRTAEREGIGPRRLRELSTFAEVVPEGLKAALERVWGARHADAYSTSELGFLALECPGSPGYHVQSEHVLLEVLRPDGSACEAGETGRVVVTALHGFAMPLLRYAIGDHARVGGECGCGRRLPVLERILGRVRNMLVLPNGERVWPLFGTNLISRAAPVRQCRLVQRTRTELTLELSTARALSADEERAIERLVLDTLGHPFALTLAYVPSIARAASGKFEEFRCEVPD